MKDIKKESSFISILPIIIFVTVFLGSGVVCAQLGYEKPFAQFPASMGAYIALISAFLIIKGSFADKFNWMLTGIAKPHVIVPIIVFALAGGFAGTAKAAGGVEAIVNLCLNYVPIGVITAGFFCIASIVAFASGSSVSTIVAISPIALSIAASANISIPIMVAAVMGAAMFGNSISLISDCTIVSNSVLGIATGKAVKDKFILQGTLYTIPFILTVILLVVTGQPDGAVVIESAAVNYIAILPYVFIFIMAIIGVNFVLSLSCGIIISAGIGVMQGQFNLLEASTTVASGMYGMSNMILMFIFMAGTIGIVNAAGGIDWLISRITKFIKGQKSAQFVVFILSIFVTCCVGNDTIPMVTIGDVVKDISVKYKVDPRKMASILPIATASTAVILPYTGAALTMSGLIDAGGYNVSFLESVPVNFFVLFALIAIIISIFTSFGERVLNKDPWNFEKWCTESEIEKR